MSILDKSERTKLEIIAELEYNNKHYYVDNDEKFYRIAPGVNCPNSPIVSFKVYNDSKYYERIEESKLIDALMKSYNKSIGDI